VRLSCRTVRELDGDLCLMALSDQLLLGGGMIAVKVR
jgi:hypothetical protein